MKINNMVLYGFRDLESSRIAETMGGVYFTNLLLFVNWRYQIKKIHPRLVS